MKQPLRAQKNFDMAPFAICISVALCSTTTKKNTYFTLDRIRKERSETHRNSYRSVHNRVLHFVVILESVHTGSTFTSVLVRQIWI